MLFLNIPIAQASDISIDKINNSIENANLEKRNVSEASEDELNVNCTCQPACPSQCQTCCPQNSCACPQNNCQCSQQQTGCPQPNCNCPQAACPCNQPSCVCPAQTCAPSQAYCATVEKPYIIEHLPTHKGSSVNMVKVTQSTATIIANNVLKVIFTGDFNSKTACDNDVIALSLPNGLTTCEGRQLLPCGTQVVGRIQCVQKPKWANRNAKVYVVFDRLVLPNCACVPMCARVYGKDCVLKRSSWAAVGKAAAYTVGLFGVGTGLGAAIGAAAHSMGNGAGFGALAFGMPIGGGVGLLVGTLTPGLHYKAKCGKPVYIQLAQDLELCYK